MVWIASLGPVVLMTNDSSSDYFPQMTKSIIIWEQNLKTTRFVIERYAFLKMHIFNENNVIKNQKSLYPYHLKTHVYGDILLT